MPCFDLWGWWIPDTEGTLIWTAKQSVDVEIIQVHRDRMRSTKDHSAIEVKQSCHLVMDFTIGMYCNMMRHDETCRYIQFWILPLFSVLSSFCGATLSQETWGALRAGARQRSLAAVWPSEAMRTRWKSIVTCLQVWKVALLWLTLRLLLACKCFQMLYKFYMQNNCNDGRMKAAKGTDWRPTGK